MENRLRLGRLKRIFDFVSSDFSVSPAKVRSGFVQTQSTPNSSFSATRPKGGFSVESDNLNTHDKSAFYENLPADEARALAKRFEFHFTPKSASWLNMIEIEFSALSRQCLNRRIPTIEELTSEILALVAERDKKRIKIDWQFSIQSARDKLNRHYTDVNVANEKFKKT